MITQKPISFKIDSVQLEKLSLTCQRVRMSRNQLLNFLVTYCNLFWNDYLSIANPRHQVFNKTGDCWKLYTSLVYERKPLHRYDNNDLKYIYLCLGKDLYLRLLNTPSHRYQWLEHSQLCHEIVEYHNNMTICV